MWPEQYWQWLPAEGGEILDFSGVAAGVMPVLC